MRRATLALILGLTAARILYLIFLCPYELVADEAQYWDWSRRLDLSYYSKGPGIAWLIGASTRLFGDAEWAVRLPAPLSMALAMLALAWLATRAALGDRRAGLLAAIAFCLIPGYHVAAILITIDAPYLACWALAGAATYALADARRAGRAGWGPATVLGAALGAGFLLKYTILLLVPGALLWLLMDHRAAPGPADRRNSPALAPPLLLIAALLALAALPVLIWNQRHGWPTVAHLLGHIGSSAGDQPRAAGRPWSYSPLNTLELIGSQLAILGPMAGLIVLSCVLARRSRDPALRRAARFAVLTSAPILCFYLALTAVSDVEGNWPIAGYLTLLVPVALVARTELPRRAALVREWFADPARPRPWRGYLRRTPETPFQVLWHWSIGYGIVGALGVLMLAPIARLPIIGPLVPIHRLSGAREYARGIHEAIESLPPATRHPAIIADQYTRAALLAYYLPGHPSVSSATSLLGGRKSSYDYFPDTDPRAQHLDLRDAVLVGDHPDRWRAALDLSSVRQLLPERGRRRAVYLGSRVNQADPAP